MIHERWLVGYNIRQLPVQTTLVKPVHKQVGHLPNSKDVSGRDSSWQRQRMAGRRMVRTRKTANGSTRKDSEW